MSEDAVRRSHEGLPAPKSKRGKETREKLIHAAQELLEEGGYNALTSNAVVQRAGVSAPIFYRHFKDKYALLQVLGERLTVLQNDIYGEAISRGPTSNPAEVEELSYETLLEIWRVASAFVGARPLLVSLRAVPNLSAVRLEEAEYWAKMTSRQLRNVRPDLSEEEAYDRSRLIMEIGYSVVEMLLEVPELSAKPILKQTAKATTHIFFN